MIEKSAHPTPAIARDLPCITCGYNLRGLESTGYCPECGTLIQRSIDLREQEASIAPRVWARMVLAGLVVWMLLTPYFLATTLWAAGGFSDRTPRLPWVNYPGPKLWATHLLQSIEWSGLGGPSVFIKQALVLVLVTAIYLLTWPIRPTSGIEQPFTLRTSARWACLLLTCGMLAININVWRILDGTGSPIVGTSVIFAVELPCTLLLYLYLSNLALRLDLQQESVWLRLCGWAAAGSMVVSVILIAMEFPPRTGHQPVHLIFIFALGAIMGAAAVVATGNLIRLAMALWPMATGKSRQPTGS